MTQYTPAPDSLAARVIEFLQVDRGTLTPAKIADLFTVSRASVSNVLKAAVQAGALQHHAGGRGKTGYHLAGTVPSFDAAEATPAPKKATNTTRKPREATPEPATVPPIAALWSDGDIVVYGAQINADDTATLNDRQARQLHRFLERCFGPNE